MRSRADWRHRHGKVVWPANDDRRPTEAQPRWVAAPDGSGSTPRGRESLGNEKAKIDFEITPNQSRWGVDVSGKVKAWAEALKGPTSTSGEPPRMSSPPGSETGPGQIVTWGKSTVCKVDVFGLDFSWTVSSAKHIPFDWSGDSLPIEIP